MSAVFECERLPADEDLEYEIRRAGQILEWAYARGDKYEKESAWLRFTQLVNRRSPAQVERMERERGLR